MDYKDVLKQIEIQMPQTSNQKLLRVFEEIEHEQDNSDLLNKIGLELQRKGGF